MLVAFTGVQGVGQTFMDWSFNFLLGRKTYWNHKKGLIPLTNNPISKHNAHQHQRNHPGTLSEVRNFIAIAGEEIKKHNELITFYPTIDGVRHIDNSVEENEKMINFLVAHGVLVFCIKPTKPYPYSHERTDMDEGDLLDHLRELLNMKSMERKKIRAQASLLLMKKKQMWLDDVARSHGRIDKLVSHTFNDVEWIEETERCMLKIFRILKMKPKKENLTRWRDTRSRWLEKMKSLEEWYDSTIPLINDKILENQDMDLSIYDLDILKEIMIMAYLWKDHGRNLVLPTDEFPKNTKDLHRYLK